MTKYAIVGLSLDKVSRRIIKRHFGTIEFNKLSRQLQFIKIRFVNSRDIQEIYNRNKRIFEKIVKVINKEYALEDLSVTTKCGNRCFLKRRKKGRYMPKTKRRKK